MSCLAPVSTHLAKGLCMEASELPLAGSERGAHRSGDFQTGDAGPGLILAASV